MAALHSRTSQLRPVVMAVTAVVAGVALLLAGVSQARDLVWVVQGEHNRVYLAGSIHLMPPEAYPLPAVYERAYEASELLAFETDIGALSAPQTQLQLLSEAAYPPGQTLAQHLPAPLFAKLQAALEKSGTPLALVNGLRPWFAAFVVELSALQTGGYRADLGLDSHFHQRAQADGKRVEALESLSRHIQLLTGMTAAEQENFLASTLDDLAALESAPEDILRIWQSGDSESLAAMEAESRRKFPAFHQRLIANRNRQWAEKIDRLLQQESNAMVIVGAIHLVGDEGLPALLRARGYRPVQQ